MAAAIKALNARIRSNPVSDYFCSTHFWGPASNFGIPIAAVLDTQKDPEIISGRMTLALCCYSAVFMRYALAVTPPNYLLFGCHFVNFTAQSAQAYRFTNHWYLGGRKEALEVKAKEGLRSAEGAVKDVVGDAKDSARGVVDEVKGQLGKVTGR